MIIGNSFCFSCLTKFYFILTHPHSPINAIPMVISIWIIRKKFIVDVIRNENIRPLLNVSYFQEFEKLSRSY
jgi:hypothetical protein